MIWYRGAAEVVVLAHATYVGFVVFGLATIAVGLATGTAGHAGRNSFNGLRRKPDGAACASSSPGQNSPVPSSADGRA